MIRVLTFGRFADHNFGGLERYVFELARGLESEVHFTNIVARRGPAPDLDLVGETIHTRAWASLSGTPICPAMPFFAMRRHWQEPFDIVHLQFPADPMAHLATELMPRSVRRVITWHSDIVRQQRLLRVYRPFLQKLLSSADAIIAPTPVHFSTSRQLASLHGKEIFHVVPFGFDLHRFAQRPPYADEIRRRQGDGFLIFSLGRHVYYKGFEYLVRALTLLPQATLVLGGEGPLTEQLKRAATDAGVSQRVHFPGRIPEADLPAYYHACDVFCMPSVEPAEAFGIVQLEAMASGKPVICCELHNGVTWVNLDGVTGVVVPPADSLALAGALRRLAGDRVLRERLGGQARERADRIFSTKAMAAGTLEVYKRVLQSRR